MIQDEKGFIRLGEEFEEDHHNRFGDISENPQDGECSCTETNRTCLYNDAVWYRDVMPRDEQYGARRCITELKRLVKKGKIRVDPLMDDYLARIPYSQLPYSPFYYWVEKDSWKLLANNPEYRLVSRF